MKLLLIRHAQSTKTILNRIGVSGVDYRLTSFGRQSAHDFGILIDPLGRKAEKIYIGDSSATLETASLIWKNTASPTLLQGLHSIDLGVLSGLSFEEIETQYPEYWSQLYAYMCNTLHPRDFSFPGAESIGDFETRIFGGLETIIRHTNKFSVLVAHRSVITAILNICVNTPSSIEEGEFKYYNLPPLSISLVKINRDLSVAEVLEIGLEPNAQTLQLLSKYF